MRKLLPQYKMSRAGKTISDAARDPPNLSKVCAGSDFCHKYVCSGQKSAKLPPFTVHS